MKNIQIRLKHQIQKLKRENKEQQQSYNETLNEKINKEKLIIKENLERLLEEKINELEKKIFNLEEKKEILHTK